MASDRKILAANALATVVTFARLTWRDDGAEGEAVHRLCDAVDHYTRMKLFVFKSIGDMPPEEISGRIEDAHPLTTNRFDLAVLAQRLVDSRHQKSELIGLVQWLLNRLEDSETFGGHAARRIAELQSELEAIRAEKEK